MASHLFNKAGWTPHKPLASAPRPQQNPLSPALAAILDHPTMFVTTVWIVFCVAVAVTQ
jgi:hypothetical protein